MDLLREKARCRGAHILRIGGDSESKSDQINEQTDRRVSGGAGGAQISGDSNTVTVQSTDHGAVYAGTELARAALTVSAATMAEAFKGQADSVKQAITGVESAYSKGRAGEQEMLSMGVMAVVGLAAIVVLPALFKKA